MSKKIKDLITVENGLFQKMPEELFEGRMDARNVDIEFLAKYGERSVNRLVSFFITNGELDTTSLAKLLYDKRGFNWNKMFEVMYQDYNAFLTGSRDEVETRTVTETIDSKNESSKLNTGTQESTYNIDNTTTKTGDVSRVLEGNDVYNITDSRNTTDSTENTFGGSDSESKSGTNTDTLNKSGEDKNTTNYGTSISNNGTLTKSGSESNNSIDTNTLDLTNTTDDQRTVDNTTNQTGTQGKDANAKVYGFGSSSPINTSSNDDMRTDNLTEKTNSTDSLVGSVKNTGTETRDVNSTLSFDQRKDSTASTESKTGVDDVTTTYGSQDLNSGEFNEENTITYNKTESSDRTSSDVNKKIGTIGKSDSETTTYNNYKENQIGLNTDVRTDNLNSKVDSTGKSEKVMEDKRELSVKADSPLQTTQSLIMEELNVRKINVLDIIYNETIMELCEVMYGRVSQ